MLLRDVRAVTPSIAGARALWLQEHPNVDPSCWDMLDDETQAYWVEKAGPVVEAVTAEVWDEGFDRGFYDPLAGSTRDASESLAINPYRKAVVGKEVRLDAVCAE